jgi:hypothetical protein
MGLDASPPPTYLKAGEPFTRYARNRASGRETFDSPIVRREGSSSRVAKQARVDPPNEPEQRRCSVTLAGGGQPRRARLRSAPSPV